MQDLSQEEIETIVSISNRKILQIILLEIFWPTLKEKPPIS